MGNVSLPLYLIQADVRGKWRTVGNRFDRLAARRLAVRWARESGQRYRVTPA